MSPLRGPGTALTPFDVVAWGGLELGPAIAGGARNSVRRAARGDEVFVVRRSARSTPSLSWELDLLTHLGAAEVPVPQVVPADDGRREVDGVHVHRFVPGRRPRGRAEWARVVDVVARVHELTVDWPQRPGSLSAADLQTATSGGDVDLRTMPVVGVRAVRAAWEVLGPGPRAVVHGDVGPGNVLVHDDLVTLVDWDEARVDHPAFDFAGIPRSVDVPVEVDRGVLARAGLAWEAATCWVAEPGYAAECLQRLLR